MAVVGERMLHNQLWQWLDGGCYVTSYGNGWRTGVTQPVMAVVEGRMVRNQLWQWLEDGCYVTNYSIGWRKYIINHCLEFDKTVECY